MARIKEYENLEDYDDLDDYNIIKIEKRKSKPKKGSGKGHQSKHNKRQEWDDELLDDLNDIITPSESMSSMYGQQKKSGYETQSKPKYEGSFKKTETVTQTKTDPQSQKSFSLGPNTHDIKGSSIDFDRVDNIEKIESLYNGKKTFGIKFFFSGKKGLFRIVWFNQNSRERDSVYNSEFAFWKKVSCATQNKELT